MGCGSSHESHSYSQEKAEELWAILETRQPLKIPPEAIRVTHFTHRTIRLIVASTFKDFRNERALINTKIRQALEEFCRPRKLILIIEDLHGGRETAGAEDGETCLLHCDTIEAAFADNSLPFTVTLLGECTGWIPSGDALETQVYASFGIIPSLSMLETQLVLTAYLADNHNAMFMNRDPGFLNSIPFHKPQFIEAEGGRKRINFIKTKLKAHIPINRFVKYHCGIEGVHDTHTQFIILKDLDRFVKQVTDYMKRRIESQYSLAPDSRNEVQVADAAQATFLKRLPHLKSRRIQDLVSKISTAIRDGNGQSVIILEGGVGSGKTACLVELVRSMVMGDAVGGPTCLVWAPKGAAFALAAHFPSAGPHQRCPITFYRRILHGLFKVPFEAMVKEDENSLRQTLISKLIDPAAIPAIIILDDPHEVHESIGWLPSHVMPQIRVVLGVPSESGLGVMLDRRGVRNRAFGLGELDSEEARAEVNVWMHHVMRGAVPGIAPRPHKSALPRHHNPSISVQSTRGEHKEVGDLEAGFDQDPRRRSLAGDLVSVGFQNLALEETGAIERTSTALASAAGLRRHAVLQDVEAAQGGVEATAAPEWTALRARVLGSLLRWSVPPKVVKAAAHLSLHKLLEFELMEFESNLDGHIFIGVLCCLAVTQNGLREIELRRILKDEFTFLPDSIVRHRSTVGFNMLGGLETEIGPLRWRQADLRLRHHLRQFGGDGENRLCLASKALAHAVRLRYLSAETERAWWEGLVWAELFGRHSEVERAAEEVSSVSDAQLLKQELSRWDVLAHLLHRRPDQLFQLWEKKLGGMVAMEQTYTDLLRKSSKSLTPPELFRRTKLLANTMSSGGLDRAALAMVDGALLLKAEAMPKPTSVAALHHLKADVFHRMKIKSVGWDKVGLADSSPEIIRHIDTAYALLRKTKDRPHHAAQKMETAELCYLRAFWTVVETEGSATRSEWADEAWDNVAKGRAGLQLRTRISAFRLQIATPSERPKILEAAETDIEEQAGKFSPLFLMLWRPFVDITETESHADIVHKYNNLRKKLGVV